MYTIHIYIYTHHLYLYAAILMLILILIKALHCLVCVSLVECGTAQYDMVRYDAVWYKAAGLGITPSPPIKSLPLKSP